MLGASLLNGGSSPSFFANAVAHYFTFDMEKVKVKVHQIPVPNMKEKLTKVHICTHA